VPCAAAESRNRAAMLFNSFIFWFFFAAVFVLYRLLRHKWQNRMLLVASYVFYGAWDYRFLSLIFISTLVDYFAARGMERWEGPRRRKALLALSVCVNLGLLGTFKYYGFFANEVAALFSSVGIPLGLPSLRVVLPVGISFYTFQTMSYTIDVYRGSTRPVRDFLDFALYVAFFPQLVAGPIERSGRLMPQIVNPRPRRPEDFTEGLYLVVTGLFKKIVVADNMAVIVNGIFAAEPSRLSGGECLIGVYAFAFQIYGDFSGYSCIARGVARWLGFDLMTNFNMPYFATSPRDFWSRWHISLSTWLRDYLYIPLGGNRKGRWKTYRNLMLTMLLGGLWHGAGWTFIAWGFLHGALLIGHRLFEKRRAQPRPDARTRLANVAKALLMFHLVCVGWLLFRAQSMPQAWGMAARMFADLRFTPTAVYGLGMIVFCVAPLMALELWLHHRKDLLRLPKVSWVPRACVYSYFAIMLIAFHPTVPSEFIYFQF
jgi:D-alanyl-lipoteichoic acid acyltransferase DltB (MBOAT superfamily)